MKISLFNVALSTSIFHFCSAQVMNEQSEAVSTFMMGARRLRARDIPKLYDCPPKPEYVTPWYCPWCSPTKDTTNLDIYNEIMDLYDEDGSENPAKAITVWFGKDDGNVGSFNSAQLVTVFKAASSGNTCVREAFEDVVCYTLYHSSYFNPKTLTKLQKLKAWYTFTKFVIGFARGDPWTVAMTTKKLMQDVVVPAMGRVIGNISFLMRIDPGSKFKLNLAQCGIY